MIDIIFMGLTVAFFTMIVLFLVVTWLLCDHYVAFWRVVDRIHNYLMDTYVRGKVI